MKFFRGKTAVISILLAFVSILCSCQRQSPVTPSTSDIKFLKIDSSTLTLQDSIGSTSSFHISSNIQWTVLAQDTNTWTAVSSYSGTGDATILVSAKALNNTDTIRFIQLIIAPINAATIQPLFLTVRQTKTVTKDTLKNIFGGKDVDGFTTAVPTEDGGVMIAGITKTKGGTGPITKEDIWIVRMDKDGNMLWQKTFGGSNSENVGQLIKTKDGNYLAVGSTRSQDGDAADNVNPTGNAFIIKFDQDGNKIWAKCIGGSESGGFNKVIEESDGSFILNGTSTKSLNPLNHGGNDCWLVKIDKNGQLLWQTFLGGEWIEGAAGIITIDTGYLIYGITQSTDGDMAGNTQVDIMFIAEFDKLGNKKRIRYINSSGVTPAFISKTIDNKYILVGTYGKTGPADFWAMKIDLSFNKIWEKRFGGTGADIVNGFLLNEDGTYTLTGMTFSNDGNIHVQRGKADAWIIKVDADGNLLKERSYGSISYDEGIAIIKKSDGKYVMIGRSEGQDNGDIIGKNQGGDFDGWVQKITNF